MKRLVSAMTAAGLIEWQQRHRLTVTQASEILGVSRRQYQRSITNNRVPLQNAIICAMFDQIEEYRSVKAITARQLAKLAANKRLDGYAMADSDARAFRKFSDNQK